MKAMLALKRLLPNTLLARGVLIVLLPVLLVQVVTVYIFFERHLENVGRHARAGFAGEIAFISYLIANQGERAESLTYLFQEQTGIYTKFHEGISLPTPLPSPAFPELRDVLQQRMDLPFYVTRKNGNVVIGVALNDGILVLNTSVKRIENQTVDIFLWWMIGASVVFVYIAVVFLRNQIRPIKELADAAERFGKGQDIDSFKPSGALEVRRAGRAFLVMRERIARQIKSRTEMLAGISHDLRTPLTRMKLELAMLKDEMVASELREDVVQMEHMVNEYLNFAKNTQSEDTSLLDFHHFMSELQADYERQHHTLEIAEIPPLMLHVRETAFRRMLTNIIDNAFRYGTRCVISARMATSQHVEIWVDDDGEGIPEHAREEVFRPFTRLDPARNLNQSGVGLGLSVAQEIIRNHGGNIQLGTADMGGLRVIIHVPV